MNDHYTSTHPVDMAAAYVNARELRAAYIRQFFAKLFAKKPVAPQLPDLGHHAAA